MINRYCLQILKEKRQMQLLKYLILLNQIDDVFKYSKKLCEAAILLKPFTIYTGRL